MHVVLALVTVLTAATPEEAPWTPSTLSSSASGVRWTVTMPGTSSHLELALPLRTRESPVPLPATLTLHGPGPQTVELCEGPGCLLPTRVTLRHDGDTASVAVRLVGAAPKLRTTDQIELCCDDPDVGRTLALAGADPRTLAFPLAAVAQGEEVARRNITLVDTGALFAQRPDLIEAVAGVIFDDGVDGALAPTILAALHDGVVVSVAADDARRLGLPAGAPLPLPVLATKLDWQASVARHDDALVALLDNRVVTLPLVGEDVRAVGRGALVLRASGRSEAERVAGLLRAVPDFAARADAIGHIGEAAAAAVTAGLQPPSSAGAAWLGGAFVVAAALVLVKGLRRGRASPTVLGVVGRAGAVGAVGLGALLGVSVFGDDVREVRVDVWGPGDGGRRVARVVGRAPGSTAVVGLERDLAGEPISFASVVGSGAWRARDGLVARDDTRRIEARLPSSRGLIGTWLARDRTPGALRLTDGVITNTLPFPVRFVVAPWTSGAQGGSEPLRVAPTLAPGATVAVAAMAEARVYGTIVEERLVRELLRGGAEGVGIAEVDGVLTAIEVTP